MVVVVMVAHMVHIVAVPMHIVTVRRRRRRHDVGLLGDRWSRRRQRRGGSRGRRARTGAEHGQNAGDNDGTNYVSHEVSPFAEPLSKLKVGNTTSAASIEGPMFDLPQVTLSQGLSPHCCGNPTRLSDH
jgi:hypothetical protein